MPTATDLVTDLPADFAVFGQGVDTSMAYLLGGTTGQILSKTSGTNMAFTWINNDQGDITGITATSPLTGGGSSGAITVGIQDATTSVKGSVQLSDSTSTTSSVLAATPTAVKSAYDLADAAIAKTTVTTAGDIIYRNATVPARLGIGTAGQVLTVNSGATAPQWSSPAGGGKVLQVVSAVITTATTIATTTMTDTAITLSITPTLNTSKVLVLINGLVNTTRSINTYGIASNVVRGSTDILTSGYDSYYGEIGSAGAIGFTNKLFYMVLDSPATTSSTTYKLQAQVFQTSSSASSIWQKNSYPSVITLMEIGA